MIVTSILINQSSSADKGKENQEDNGDNDDVDNVDGMELASSNSDP